MKLMREREQIRTVAQRWKEVYGSRAYAADWRGRHPGRELEALNTESATAEDVAEIVGNKSWVFQYVCNECGTETWDAVQLGEEPDHESATATICRACLVAALNLLDGK